MSSSYRRICLSHDPPLILDEDIERCVPPAQPRGHPNCKIALGRWGGGLIELWLPIPHSDPQAYCYDVSWLHHASPLARLIIETEI